MARFLGRCVPVVVHAVFVAHWCVSELARCDVVEACHVDRVKPTKLGHMPPPEWLHAAAGAEVVMNIVAAELVVRQGVLSLEQPEGLCLDHGLPEARLQTDRAVALACSLRQVDLALEAHGPAMAAALVGTVHLPIVSLRAS